jgi:hypothetical protein
MKITHYTIAEHADDEDGRNRSTSWHVQKLIEKGWQPFGSPFAIRGLECQAMVKYEVTSPSSVPGAPASGQSGSP